MGFGMKKVVLGIATVVLGVGLIGGAAFAAFPPAAGNEVSPGAQEQPGKPGKPGDRLKAILDKLVADKKITAEQENLILDAVKADRPTRPLGVAPKGPHGFANIEAAAATYIGVTPAELMAARKDGKSLAQIAIDHAKTRAGLIDALTSATNGMIDKALADKKITADQATKAKQMFAANVGKLVDATPRKPGAPFKVGPGAPPKP